MSQISEDHEVEAPERESWVMRYSELLVKIGVIVIALAGGFIFGYLFGIKDGFDHGVEITELVYKSYGR